MQLVQQFQIRGIQLRPLGIADHIRVAFLLNFDPERLCHLVEDTSNAPLHGGALHRVGQAALNGFNVRILRTVPLCNKAFALKVDGNAADLCVLLSVSVPRLVVVVPVFRPHDLIQAVLNSAVCDIRNSKAAGLVFRRHLNAPFQILRCKWPGQFFPDGLCVFCHMLPSNKVFQGLSVGDQHVGIVIRRVFVLQVLQKIAVLQP